MITTSSWPDSRRHKDLITSNNKSKNRFLFPWELGHCFTTTDHFHYEDEDEIHDGYIIRNFSVSSNFEYVAFGDFHGNISVLGRNENFMNYMSRSRKNCVGHSYGFGGEIVHSFCFDRRCNSNAIFIHMEKDDGAHILSIINDVSIYESDRYLRCDHVVILPLNYGEAQDMRCIISPASSIKEEDDAISCVRFHFYKQNLSSPRNGTHYVVDLIVNLADGSFTQNVVMEFVQEPRNTCIYLKAESRLSPDGRYFSIFHESRSERCHSILVRDLDNNPNADIWISTDEMGGPSEGTQLFFAGNKAVISFANEDEFDNDDDRTPFFFRS